jgi:hypothetical protein
MRTRKWTAGNAPQAAYLVKDIIPCNLKRFSSGITKESPDQKLHGFLMMSTDLIKK